MLAAKFVTPDLKSSDDYEQLDYSNFGSPVIITNPYLKENDQYAHGINVFPLTENINFTNISFTNTLILLHVEPEHIIFQKNNGKMQVSQATPIKRLTEQDSEYRLIRKECLKTPKSACLYAKFIDQQPKDETRNASINDPFCAFFYALDIDQQPKKNTRNACLIDPYYAFYYARDIDRRPRTDTRNACLINLEFAFQYALEIDKCSRDDTRNACLIDPKYAYYYAKEIDKQPRDDTRNITLNDPQSAFLYAKDVDKQPRNDTRQSASTNPFFEHLYKQFEKDYNSDKSKI
jgi:hypothetical protein